MVFVRTICIVFFGSEVLDNFFYSLDGDFRDGGWAQRRMEFMTWFFIVPNTDLALQLVAERGECKALVQGFSGATPSSLNLE